jgi:hypothetical protein
VLRSATTGVTLAAAGCLAGNVMIVVSIVGTTASTMRKSSAEICVGL